MKDRGNVSPGPSCYDDACNCRRLKDSTMTDPTTTGGFTDPHFSDSFIVAATRESDGAFFVQQLLAVVEAVAVDTGIWRIGNGYGGQVHRWLDEIAEQRGHAEPQRTPRVTANTIPASVRLAVFERDAFRCRHCDDWHDLTVDHIDPVSKGGSDASDNLQTLCRRCNSRKGNR